MNFRTGISLFFSLLISVNIFAQVQNDVGEKYSDLSFSRIADTLVSNKDFRIYSGKMIICGKASGENAWYKHITFKSGASWPVVLFRNTEIKNNIEYQVDEDIRTKDKVKEFLHVGDTLVVTKILNRGNKRHGDVYVLYLRQGHGIASINYSCFIADALKSKELLVHGK